MIRVPVSDPPPRPMNDEASLIYNRFLVLLYTSMVNISSSHFPNLLFCCVIDFPNVAMPYWATPVACALGVIPSCCALLKWALRLR